MFELSGSGLIFSVSLGSGVSGPLRELIGCCWLPRQIEVALALSRSTVQRRPTGLASIGGPTRLKRLFRLGCWRAHCEHPWQQPPYSPLQAAPLSNPVREGQVQSRAASGAPWLTRPSIRPGARQLARTIGGEGAPAREWIVRNRRRRSRTSTCREPYAWEPLAQIGYRASVLRILWLSVVKVSVKSSTGEQL